MSTWSKRRQITITSVILIIVLIVLGFLVFKVLYNPPSCFDEKQNQDEEGIDCGGSCELLCTKDTFDPLVKWQRIFSLGQGVYTAAILVENQNFNAKANNVPFLIKVFNTDGIVIYERKGEITLLPRTSQYVIEPRIFVYEQKPSRITFEFTGGINWQKSDQINSQYVIDQIVSQSNPVGEGHIVTARVTNNSVSAGRNIKIGAVLFDQSDNAIGASQTLVEVIPGGESKNITFTWPEELLVSRVDIKPVLTE